MKELKRKNSDENDSTIISDHSKSQSQSQPENIINNLSKKRTKKVIEKEKEENLEVTLYAKRLRLRSKNDDYFKKLSLEEQLHILKSEDRIFAFSNREIPLKYRILQSTVLDTQTKNTLLSKLEYFEKLHPDDTEYSKMTKWVDSLNKLPLDRFIEFPISKTDELPKIQSFMNECTQILNSTIYGQTRAKNKILELIAQRISNPKSTCSVIALTGPPGVGKTSLIKNGVSKALKYPFGFTALGGATDASFLEGHAYTYEGSHYGRIVEMLIETQCMNPILFFDELDKISNSAKGAEIAGILTHITDTTQNNSFHDKYLFGLNIDLSKCIFFFSLNDISLINPILRDRLTIVEFDKYSIQDKIHIAQNHLIQEITSNIGIQSEDYIFTEDIIKHIIECTSKDEDGIRNLKRGFEKIFMKINYDMYMLPEKQLIQITEKPYTFTKEDIQKILDHNSKKKKNDPAESSLSMLYI
jgi:ATP-dependent Lon protease